MKIDTIRTASGEKKEVFVGLKKGDKLIAKITKFDMDDLGMSGQTFSYESFTKDKEYVVDHLSEIYFKSVAYVQDNSGTLFIATPKLFIIP